MAQTTGQLAGANCLIEVSDDNAAWVDISGSANKVDPGEQTRMVGEDYTFEGDNPIVASTKMETMEITVDIVYTETAGEAFETLRAWWEVAGGQDVWMRYSPAGGNVDDFMFTSGKGKMSGFTYPPPAASEGKPLLCGFKIKVPGLSKSVISA